MKKEILSYNERIFIFVGMLLLYIGVIISYKFVVANAYGYMGFVDELNYIKLFACLILSTFLISLNLFIKKGYYCIIYNFTFIFFYIGIVTIYQFENKASFVPTFVMTFTLILIKCFEHMKKVKLVSKVNWKSPDKKLVTLAFILFVPFLIYLPHINLKNLFFIDVYETRTLFANISYTLLDYIKAPLSRVVLPILIISAIEKKDSKIFVFVAMIIYIYLCGALKSIFLGLIALIFFYKGRYFQKTAVMILFFICCSYIGIGMYLFFDSTVLINLPIRRVLIVPGELTSDYWLYFKDNLTYLSHSPFGLGIVKYQYPIDIIHYYGEFVLGKPGSSPNVGIITEGLFSFGMIGGLLFGLIYVLILVYFDAIDLDPKYFGILFVYIYYLNTALLSTLLLTHGLFFLMIFSYFFLKKNERTGLDIRNIQ